MENCAAGWNGVKYSEKLIKLVVRNNILIVVLSLSFFAEVKAEQTSPPLSDSTATFMTRDSSSFEDWVIHGQLTNVSQRHPNFTSPYSGQNSLVANGRTEETTDITIYAGLRLWRDTELWINPEIDQGFGLSNTVGLAGFSSGEAYKIGANTPYLRIPRFFIKHIFLLGSSIDELASIENQLAGTKPIENITLTIGKFSVTDVFDTNRYAHDPRTDFLNWSVIDAGAFDYAADAWGFTYGAAAEWTKSTSALRGGIFQLSKIPNGKVTAIDFGQYMLVGEIEKRYDWLGCYGKVKLLGFVNRAPIASYEDAIELGHQTGNIPDVSLVRRNNWKSGASINLEQTLSHDLATFARVSVNDGSKESYEFTEINKSFSGGLVMKGERWGRVDDTLGVAGVINGLSRDARNYFKEGGLGILIGDGQLRYGHEKIAEVYYSAHLNPSFTLSLNYQHINNPAYNLDRGPVSIFGIRVHAEF